MAAIEALAAGVPVLGTSVSGLSQIIEHNRSGLVVARQAESLADAICYLLGNSERLEMLRRGARAVFSERFHIERCAAGYDDLYHRAFDSG
jgi:glycosyltransferase involved in cell wall biosynthesis